MNDYFLVPRGLFKAEHFDKLDESIWLLLLFMSRDASHNEEVVFDPEEVAETLGTSYRKVKEWFSVLISNEYVFTYSPIGVMINWGKYES
jgi:hypothetical protein